MNEAGTRIRVTAVIHPLFGLFAILWLAAVVVGFAVEAGHDFAQHPAWAFAVMFAFGLLAPTAGFYLDAIAARDTLERVLSSP